MSQFSEDQTKIPDFGLQVLNMLDMGLKIAVFKEYVLSGKVQYYFQFMILFTLFLLLFLSVIFKSRTVAFYKL